MANYRLGDIGAKIRMQIVDETGAAVDVSNATLLQYRFQKPDGTAFQTTPTFSNAGTDGLIEYLTVSGDLSQKGVYQVQARVTIDANHDYHSDTMSFSVDGNL